MPANWGWLNALQLCPADCPKPAVFQPGTWVDKLWTVWGSHPMITHLPCSAHPDDQHAALPDLTSILCDKMACLSQ